MAGKRIDLTGRVFGILTVVDFATIENKVALWNCRCKCGTQIKARASRLMNGTTLHCGCEGYRKDSIRHKAARAKVSPKLRRKIAEKGAKAKHEKR